MAQQQTQTKKPAEAQPQVQVMEPPSHPLVQFRTQLENKMPELSEVLPPHIKPELFKSIILTAVQVNTDLLDADRGSLFNSCRQAANDGLLPDNREGAMVIYSTKVKTGGQEKWIKKVQWMVMILGLRKKIRNTGEVLTFTAEVVHLKDHFEFEKGDEEFLRHRPYIDGPPGKVIAAYAIAKLKNGELVREFMPIWELEKVRAVSKSKDGPAWTMWTTEMYRKAVARRLAKVLPQSTDLAGYLERDAIEHEAIALPPQPRPQLSDYRGTESAVAHGAADGTEAGGTITRPTTQEAPASEPVVTADGEIIEENPDPEFGAADAMELGRLARRENKAMRAVPPEWRDGQNDAFAEAWTEGWKSEDDGLAKSKK